MTETGKAVRKKQAAVDPEEYRWAVPGESGALCTAPVTALLALTGTLVVAREDGVVEALPVAEGPGPLLDGTRTMWRSEVPVNALTWGYGEVLGAAGERIVRYGADGSLSAGPELGAPIGALCARAGKVFAVAGPAVHTLERDGDGWRLARSTPLPEEGYHDLDIDRKGAHAVVLRRPPESEAAPPRGVVVNLATGEEVGGVRAALSEVESITDVYARFSPVTDNVYRFASRSHDVEKLARFAKSGRRVKGRTGLRMQPSTWCTPVAASPDGRYVASRQSGSGVLVWDLAAERRVLYAELDDAAVDAKLARRARRMPVAVRPLADGITVTRWAHLPVPDAATAAVAVAPGARYAVAGGADGTLTVIDGATRRIEYGDGTVSQPAVLTARVPVPAFGGYAFGDGHWVGVAPDGTVTAVDLGTGEARVPGALDFTGMDYPRLADVHDGVLVVTHTEGTRGYDLASLTEVWRAGARASAGPAREADDGFGFRQDQEGWSLYRLDAPETTLVTLCDRGLGLWFGDLHVDTVRGWAVGQDRGGRLALWRLDDGTVPHLYDGLGEVLAGDYAFTDDALWLYTDRLRDGALYRLALPPREPWRGT
ncbi:hypothetical protein [Actinocorallia populi]|uniref:hypothetical protein n=1 Tax=Actinocorallia populi TaxID=2079200 RepID=UPI001300BB31|nr:hypothetical protein [Actinocorallia populi]